MNKLTIIGLGLDDSDLTLKAYNEIKNAKNVIVRTNKAISYNVIKSLGVKAVSLDYVYEKSRNFDTLNKNLCKEVLTLSVDKDTLYLVDGCALEDLSVKEILKKRSDATVYSGISAKDKCLERLKIVSPSCHTISSYDLLLKESYTLPLVVYAVDSKHIASEIKLTLMDEVGEDFDVYVSSNAKTEKIKVYELDRLDYYDYSTSIFIDKKELVKKERFTFDDLLTILEILRGENGCPWDRVQTPKSIEKNIIEEAYELIDAIEDGDDDKIIEETGDLLLQAAFYVIFGKESGSYSKADVLSGICSKLITRHTHVFGSDVAKNSLDALDNWNKNKVVEKGYKNGAEYLKSVPNNLPALMRSQKVTARAKKYNFDFADINGVFDKIKEEVLEVKSAIESKNQTEITKECGDLLFSVVNLCRLLEVDAETSLITSTNKFISRFSKLEEAIIKDGKNIKDLSILEIDNYYEKIKSNE